MNDKVDLKDIKTYHVGFQITPDMDTKRVIELINEGIAYIFNDVQCISKIKHNLTVSLESDKVDIFIRAKLGY